MTLPHDGWTLIRTRYDERELDRGRKVRFGCHDVALDIGPRRVVAQQPVQAAQSVAQILARTGGDPIEQRTALGGFRLGSAACLDDRNVIFADVLHPRLSRPQCPAASA
jgi:hypothetical protein